MSLCRWLRSLLPKSKRSLAAKLVRSIQPGQLVVKIVHDQLVKLLGTEENGLNFNVVPPASWFVTGLQGSGKTTTSAKLAKRLGKTAKCCWHRWTYIGRRRREQRTAGGSDRRPQPADRKSENRWKLPGGRWTLREKAVSTF